MRLTLRDKVYSQIFSGGEGCRPKARLGCFFSILWEDLDVFLQKRNKANHICEVLARTARPVSAQ